jgi:hypothetical protein
MAYLLHVSPTDLRRMSYTEFRLGLRWVSEYTAAKAAQRERAG